jgi:hypothetical protein
VGRRREIAQAPEKRPKSKRPKKHPAPRKRDPELTSERAVLKGRSPTRLVQRYAPLAQEAQRSAQHCPLLASLCRRDLPARHPSACLPRPLAPCVGRRVSSSYEGAERREESIRVQGARRGVLGHRSRAEHSFVLLRRVIRRRVGLGAPLRDPCRPLPTLADPCNVCGESRRLARWTPNAPDVIEVERIRDQFEALTRG